MCVGGGRGEGTGRESKRDDVPAKRVACFHVTNNLQE